MLLGNVILIFYHVPITNNDQPAAHHFIQIVSNHCDPKSPVIGSILRRIHFELLLLDEVFILPRLRFPLTFPWITHFTSSHPPSLIGCPKKDSLRRSANVNYTEVYKGLLYRAYMCLESDATMLEATYVVVYD